MTTKLDPCPSSPNCVSSLSSPDDAVHYIEPLRLPSGDPVEALEAAILSLPRTRIESRDDDYLHATQRSKLFRFVDDLEFLVDRDAGVIHVRSASRVGYGDMGVNRTRVESIRGVLAAD